MATNSNKRMKPNEESDDDMDWGDAGFEFTAEEFDIAQTQAIKGASVAHQTQDVNEVTFLHQTQPANASLSVKPTSNEDLNSLRKQIKTLRDIQDEKQGQISILQEKFQEKCKELAKEKSERESLIEQRLRGEVKKAQDLKMKNDKLETDLQFQNQEKLKLISKLAKLEKQPKENLVNTPKKLKTSTNSALPKFPNNESFFQAAISKETKTTQTNDENQLFQKGTNIKNKLLKINNIVRPIITSETTENNTSKVQQVTPVQINLLVKENIPKLCIKSIYSLTEMSGFNHQKEKLLTCYKVRDNNENVTNAPVLENELLKNTVIVLEEYLNFISVTFEKQNLSVSIFNSGDKPTEPLEIELKKWNHGDEIKYEKHCSSVLWVLKYFYSHLNRSHLLRDAVLKDTVNFHPYQLFLRESPVPSDSSNSQSNSIRNEGKYTIASVLFASAIPIKIHRQLQNHVIVKTILNIIFALLKYCDQCCANEYSSLLKQLPLVAYVQSSFPHDISILALELMSLGVRSVTVRDIFNKHKDDDQQCLLHNISNSIAGTETSNGEMVTLKTKLLGDFIKHHGVEHVLNIDGACLRAFVFSFLTWFEKVVLNDEINEDELLGYLSFLNIITSIRERRMRTVEQRMQKFVPIVRHLSYSRDENSHSGTEVNALLKKLTLNFPKYGPID